MLRTFGKTMSKLRVMANDFRRQFDDALKEAELDGVKQFADDVRSLNPKNEIVKALSPMEKAAQDVRAGLDAAMKPDASNKATATAAQSADPAKVGSTAAAAEATTDAPAASAGSVAAAPVAKPAASTAKRVAAKTASTATAKPKPAAAKAAATKAAAPKSSAKPRAAKAKTGGAES